MHELAQEQEVDLHMAFNESLLTSQYDVIEVARYFVRQGKYTVRLPEITLRPKRVYGGADRGDLFVIDENGIEFLVEAKGHAEKPFVDLQRYPAQIIDKVSALDTKTRRPDYYFILGSERRSALVYDMKRFDEEKRITRLPDQITGSLVDCYMVPREACKLRTL